MKNMLADLVMSSKIKGLIQKSKRKFLNLKVSDDVSSHLNKFFYINQNSLHEALENFRDKKLDYQMVKDALENVLYENVHFFANAVKIASDKQLASINSESKFVNPKIQKRAIVRLKTNIASAFKEEDQTYN